MNINTTFMNSLLQHQFRTDSKMMQLMMYNDAVFFIYLRVPVTAYHYEGNCIYSSNITSRK